MVLLLDREGAEDGDLVFFDWGSIHQKDTSLFDDSEIPEAKPEGAEREAFIEDVKAGRKFYGGEAFATLVNRTPAETAAFAAALKEMIRMFTFSRIRVIVLPRTVKGSLNERPYIERGWNTLEAIFASYCSRLIYSSGKGNEDVEELMAKIIEPERVIEPQNALKYAYFLGKGDRDLLIQMLRKIYSDMPAIPRDQIGFEQFCSTAKIAWLRVATVKRFASRPGPFPRRQELPVGSFVVGAPPRSQRKFVVSHGWESEVHPSPSGYKMRKLAEALLTAEARDDDCVFFDFCANAQEAKIGRVYAADEPWKGAPKRSATAEAYFSYNDVAYISGRTPAQDAAFSYAMWDMGRLYAYEECEIIVLPELSGKASFPGASDTWGMENSTPYEFRGWCCSEFATALASSPDPRKRIKNFDDPAVQRVFKSRTWPRTVSEYAQMMRYTRWDEPEANAKHGLTYEPKLGVDFTSKGDRLVVKFNFYKVTFDPQAWAAKAEV